MATDQQNDWMRRVLGVSLGTEPPIDAKPARIPMRPQPRQPEPARFVSIHCVALWEAAVDKAVAETEQLADVLEDKVDPNSQQIGAACAGEIQVRLRGELAAALRAVDAVPASEWPATRAKAQQVIEQYQGRIKEDRLFSLLEGNPDGVQVPLSSTLLDALDQIGHELAAAAPALHQGAAA